MKNTKPHMQLFLPFVQGRDVLLQCNINYDTDAVADDGVLGKQSGLGLVLLAKVVDVDKEVEVACPLVDLSPQDSKHGW